MTKYKKRVKLSTLSESKIHRVTVEETGLIVELEMNQSWDDMFEIQRQAEEAKEAGEKQDMSKQSLRALVGMIVSWNVDGDNGKPAVIDVQNVKALKGINLKRIFTYIGEQSVEVSKKQKKS